MGFIDPPGLIRSIAWIDGFPVIIREEFLKEILAREELSWRLAGEVANEVYPPASLSATKTGKARSRLARPLVSHVSPSATPAQRLLRIRYPFCSPLTVSGFLDFSSSFSTAAWSASSVLALDTLPLIKTVGVPLTPALAPSLISWLILATIK